jgi:hypothetical protein
MNTHSDDDASIELHIQFYDELTALAEQLVSINFFSQEEIDIALARIGELIDLLKRAHACGLVFKATDLTKRQRSGLRAFVCRLCEDSIDKQNLELLRAAITIANLTYIEDEYYHELHYDFAIVRYCARRLGVPLNELAENRPWGLTEAVRKRFDDIASRSFSGLLDSFELEVVKKNGRTQVQVQQRR